MTQEDVNNAVKRKLLTDFGKLDEFLNYIPLCFKRKFAACDMIKEKFPTKKRVKSSTVERMFNVSRPTADKLRNGCGCE